MKNYVITEELRSSILGLLSIVPFKGPSTSSYEDELRAAPETVSLKGVRTGTIYDLYHDDKTNREEVVGVLSDLHQPVAPVQPSAEIGDLPDFEDALELAFWDFDNLHKEKSGPSERDAFKQVLRRLFSMGLDPTARGLRAELLARRMEVASQSKIIESLRAVQPSAVVSREDLETAKESNQEMRESQLAMNSEITRLRGALEPLEKFKEDILYHAFHERWDKVKDFAREALKEKP